MKNTRHSIFIYFLTYNIYFINSFSHFSHETQIFTLRSLIHTLVRQRRRFLRRKFFNWILQQSKCFYNTANNTHWLLCWLGNSICLISAHTIVRAAREDNRFSRLVHSQGEPNQTKHFTSDKFTHGLLRRRRKIYTTYTLHLHEENVGKPRAKENIIFFCFFSSDAREILFSRCF